ncbi:MAG: 4-alpha-glucanotransferase [Acidobacteria bacterium]|nr:4-alpha-glucanotransferase [Acidobacteriota bacterium]
MSIKRASGILLHITSLPSAFGIGDLGRTAYHFADFLSLSKQGLWQILPLTPTGFGDSPYQSYSAFAGNTNLISPEKLGEEGLLSQADLTHRPEFNEDRVQFEAVIQFKNDVLAKAYQNFRDAANPHLRAEFEAFCVYAKRWLNDYALFRALLKAHHGAAWNRWPKALALRDEAALVLARKDLHEEIEAQKFYQYLFFKQWFQLKAYCAEKRVKIIGDVPIFVAHNSSDVWASPELFKLKADGSPVVVAGVPPDYFSQDGQLWGNPIYNWEKMRDSDFQWWVERLRETLKLVDMARIDHFRGFAAAWEVPAEDQTARNGKWVDVPGRALFEALHKAFDELPIFAEDLGVITHDVEALRDDFKLPGMKILQFGLGGDANNTYLPHHYPRHAVVYTGTHDNDTVVGWYNSKVQSADDHAKRELQFCLKYLHSTGAEIHWDFIRAALSSVADTAIIQLQDVLGLDGQARMNLPATEEGNWNWRVRASLMTREVSDRLREMTELYSRASW